MIQATIYVDGLPFSGLDPDGSDYLPPGFGAWGKGFHNTHTQAGSDILLFGGEPYVIVSGRGIQSYMERILARLADGRLVARTIEIRIEAAP